MIKQTLVIQISNYDMPDEVQSSLEFLVNDSGSCYDSGLAYKWVVYDMQDAEMDCIYQRSENVVNNFLLSQNIPVNTTVYIDL